MVTWHIYSMYRCWKKLAHHCFGPIIYDFIFFWFGIILHFLHCPFHLINVHIIGEMSNVWRSYTTWSTVVVIIHQWHSQNHGCFSNTLTSTFSCVITFCSLIVTYGLSHEWKQVTHTWFSIFDCQNPKTFWFALFTYLLTNDFENY